MSDDLDLYAEMLAATGMDEREVARAYFYAERYGLDALTGPGCVSFDKPMCGDWNPLVDLRADELIGYLAGPILVEEPAVLDDAALAMKEYHRHDVRYVLWLRWQDPPGSGIMRWVARSESSDLDYLSDQTGHLLVEHGIAPVGADPNTYGIGVFL